MAARVRQSVLTLTIDGKRVECRPGMTVLEAAEAAGIYIPTLCRHSALPPFGACRLCIVEIEGMKGFPTSCTTPAEDGMVVRTNTERVAQLRRLVLELILSEHPSACLFCHRREECEEFRGHTTKAGSIVGCLFCPKRETCELKELVERIGLDSLRFEPVYRDIPVEKLDPFFDRDYNLCVHCARCVRICQEVRGTGAIDFVKRGPYARIGTAFGKLHVDVGCQFCGACVDVCPTGALSDRTSKWEAKGEESIETTCVLCPVGCSIEVETTAGAVARTKAKESGGVNDGQLCVLGRFALRELTRSRKRLGTPLVKRNGHLVEVGWDEAIEKAAEGLSRFQAGAVTFLFPNSITQEEAFVFNRFAVSVLKSRAGSRAGFVRWPSGVDASLSGFGKQGCILLVGADLMRTHPILGLNVKRAVDRGAKLVVVDVVPSSLDRFASAVITTRPGALAWAVAGIAKSLAQLQPPGRVEGVSGLGEFSRWLDGITPDEITNACSSDLSQLQAAAEALCAASSVLIIAGPDAGEAQDDALAKLLGALRILAGSQPDSCRLVAVPARTDFDKRWLNEQERISQGKVKAALVMGQLLPLGDADTASPVEKLEFVVLIDAYSGPLLERADVVLPSAVFAEKRGTFVAIDGTKRRLSCVVKPFGQSKPEAEIVALLAKAMGASGFEYEDFEEITAKVEAKESAPQQAKQEAALPSKLEAVRLGKPQPSATGKWPLVLVNRFNPYLLYGHRLSGIVAGLEPLEAAGSVAISGATAREHSLSQGQSVRVISASGGAVFTVEVDETLPEGIVVSRLSPNDTRLATLVGVEPAARGVNSVAVKIEPIKEGSRSAQDS